MTSKCWGVGGGGQGVVRQEIDGTILRDFIQSAQQCLIDS